MEESELLGYEPLGIVCRLRRVFLKKEKEHYCSSSKINSVAVDINISSRVSSAKSLISLTIDKRRSSEMFG